MVSQVISSVNYDQHEILRAINALHLGGEWIDCDPCYGSGNFYKPDDIPTPRIYGDIKSGMDCRSISVGDGTVRSVMFDPPFLQTTGDGSIIKDRFGSYPTMDALWEMYEDAIREFNRILVDDGVLIVKMQNTVMSGKQWWNVGFVTFVCESLGMDKIDEFVLVAKHRMGQTNLKRQRHARKFHCFFTVYRRGKRD